MRSDLQHGLHHAETGRIERLWDRLFQPRWKVGWDEFRRIGAFTRYEKRDPIPIVRGGSKVHLVFSGAVCFAFEQEPMAFAEKRSEAVLTTLVGPGHTILHHFLPYDAETFHFYAFSDCLIADVALDDYCETFLGVAAERLAPLVHEISYPSAFALYRYNHAWISEQRTRLAAALLELGLQLGVEGPSGTALPINVTHADLSDLIGGHRTTIPRLLRQLEDERAIARRGKQIVVFIDVLREILRQGSRNPRARKAVDHPPRELGDHQQLPAPPAFATVTSGAGPTPSHSPNTRKASATPGLVRSR